MPDGSLCSKSFVNGAIEALFASLLLSSTALAADDAALLRCRGIVEASARLACYDALPLGGSEAKQGASEPKQGASEPKQGASEPKQGASEPKQAGSASKSGQGETAAQRNPGPSPEHFGMEDRIAPSLLIEKIESQIPGHFEGWAPYVKIPLANGQVWQVVDGSSRFYSVDNPKVTITRGLMGAFYLNLDGDNRTVGVKRVQ